MAKTFEKVRIYNTAKSEVLLMLEPIAHFFDIPPENSVDVFGTFDLDEGVFEIQMSDDGCISLFVPVDTYVTLNHKRLEPRAGPDKP